MLQNFQQSVEQATSPKYLGRARTKRRMETFPVRRVACNPKYENDVLFSNDAGILGKRK